MRRPDDWRVGGPAGIIGRMLSRLCIHRRLALLTSTRMAVGCAADDTVADGGADTTAAVASSSGGGAMSSDAADASSTTVAASTGAAPSTGDSGLDSGSTGMPPSSSTGGGSSDSTGGSSTGTVDNSVYTAIAIPGGLDRIRVHKANPDDDLCTWMVLVAPAMGGAFEDVATPMGWSVESGAINDVADSCAAQTPGMAGADAATTAEGSVTFGRAMGGPYPCTLDVDVTLEFAGTLPGVPTMDVMNATEIDVGGC